MIALWYQFRLYCKKKLPLNLCLYDSYSHSQQFFHLLFCTFFAAILIVTVSLNKKYCITHSLKNVNTREETIAQIFYPIIGNQASAKSCAILEEMILNSINSIAISYFLLKYFGHQNNTTTLSAMGFVDTIHTMLSLFLFTTFSVMSIPSTLLNAYVANERLHFHIWKHYFTIQHFIFCDRPTDHQLEKKKKRGIELLFNFVDLFFLLKLL